MKFLDKDYYSLKKHPQAYKDHYQEGISCILRNLILLQCLRCMTFLKKIIRLRDETLGNVDIGIQDLKNIRQEESAEELSKRIGESFQNHFRQLQQQHQITKKTLLYILIKCFKQQLSIIVPVYILVSLIKIGISMVIYELFINISEGQTKYSYIYLSVVCVLWYFNQLLVQSNSTRCYFLIQKVNVSLSMLLFGKVTYLSSYCAKSLNLGKLKNLVENDLSILDSGIGIILNLVSLPLEIIGLSTLLITRLGWPGAVGVAILFLSFVLISCFSQYYEDILDQIANFKDLRIQLTSEVIQGIKFIKMYGWQIAFEKIIQRHRQNQIKSQKKYRAFRVLQSSLGVFVGIAAGFVVFVLSHYFQTGLSTVKLYACLQLAFALNAAVNDTSSSIGIYYQVKLVFERFASILEIKQVSMCSIQQQKQKNPVKQSDKNATNIGQSCQIIIKIDDEPSPQTSKHKLETGEIKFIDFNGFWKDNFEEPTLKNINLSFRSGILYGITGRVGSGKSGLLGAITGEMPNYSGVFQFSGKVAFVEQEPVIFSETIKNNIIFGKEFNASLYQQVIQQSCLVSDFQILEKGDETLVGEKGITLSGGQKARVSLARALYVQADIYLLDDPISAVDSKIARKIQERCIKPLSKTKTVVLVTHQISFLYECEKVIILEQGRVKCQGTPKQLEDNLRQISTAFGESDKQKQQSTKKTSAVKQASIYSDSMTHKQPYQNEIKNDDQLSNKFKENALDVTFSTYFNYFFQDKLNYVLLPITIMMYIIGQVAIVLYVRLLSQYQLIVNNKQNMFKSNFDYFWLTLGLILLMYFLLLYFRAFLLNQCIFLANKAIHRSMIHSVVRSPCSYFDVIPSGTLNNRFSSDLGILDQNLSDSLTVMIEGPISILVVMVSICQAYVYFIPIVLSLMILSMLFYKYYKEVIIVAMNMNLTVKTPLYHRYNQVLNGLTSIRLYSQRPNQLQKFAEDLNRSTRANINQLLCDRGFAFSITIIGQLIMYGGLFLAVSQNGDENYQLFAGSTILLINFSNLFQIFLRFMINTDGTIISFARTNQIINLKSQFDTRTSYDEEIGLKQEVKDCENDKETHLEWPETPTIEISNVSARYREGLPLILNDISIKTAAGKRLGIVGRTGAGKSSIIQVLFRLVEPQLGSVLRIGGYDALKMGLHSLRKHISVIPQTPFLFKGSIKQNIDPFEHSTDQQIWRVLEDSGLKSHVQSFPDKLQTDISNASQSFSVGQKQLLCLARALLRKNRILVLDEATSNVDMETDAFIQSAIREKFANTTVITIAHRLNTIADYDLVVVMENGKVAEVGHPFELIQSKNKFFQMVRHTGKSSAFINQSAQKSYKKLNDRPADQ